MNVKKVISVCGLISAGKSTFAECLANRLDAILQSEPASENDKGEFNYYLNDYYKDPAGFAFKMQIFLLSQRYRSHLAAQSYALAGICDVVEDSSYWSDRVFANIQHELGYFDDRDMKTYLALHKDMQADVLYPTAMVYLDTPVDVAIDRIARRISEKEGRKCESSISKEYMALLDREIRVMVKSLSPFTTMIHLKTVTDDGTEIPVNDLVDMALDELNKIHRDPMDAWCGVL